MAAPRAVIITELDTVGESKDVPLSLFEQDHSAYFDAFMTGFVFAYQIRSSPDILMNSRNKLYLIGKQIPLLIEQSKYSKVSKSHEKLRVKLGIINA